MARPDSPLSSLAGELTIAAEMIPADNPGKDLVEGAGDSPIPRSETPPLAPAPAELGAHSAESFQRSLPFIEATQTIFATRNLEQLPQAIVEAAIRVMSADAVSLLLPRPDGTLFVAHASGLPPEVVPRTTRIGLGEGIAGRVAQSQQPLILQGFAHEGHGRAVSSIIYPLVQAGRLLGVVTFNRRRPQGPFGEADLHSAAILASQIVLALENSRLQRQSTVSERLAAVGQLAAGIAHEINTPVQFVGDSVQFVQGAMEDLARLIGRYQALRDQVMTGETVSRQLLQEIAGMEEEIELDFLATEVPRALARSLEGVRRVGEIVQAVKTFGRAETREKNLADLNELLQTAVVVARQQYVHVAALDLQLGEIPLLFCHSGDLLQVFLNLLLNAAHAIGALVPPAERGTITVRSSLVDGYLLVGVSDNGCGIPAGLGDKIFDPFFTTKDVGKGTGLGLSIARTLVVDKHGGSLTYESEVDRGTTFWVKLPLTEAT
jgi:signal transduction histidine kinase